MEDSKLRKIIREALEEEFGEMRYVATMDFYVWAHSDQEAVEQSRAIANNLAGEFDNRANVLSVVKQPHGTLGNTPVDLNETK